MGNMRASFSQLIEFVRESLLREPNLALSDDDAELLNSDGLVRLFGYAVIGVVFIGMGAWATFAPLENAAIGNGTVQWGMVRLFNTMRAVLSQRSLCRWRLRRQVNRSSN